MIRIATDSLAKQAPNSGSREDSNGTQLEVSGSALAADGPAERVAKGVSGILRPCQCRRRDLGVGRGVSASVGVFHGCCPRMELYLCGVAAY